MLAAVARAATDRPLHEHPAWAPPLAFRRQEHPRHDNARPRKLVVQRLHLSPACSDGRWSVAGFAALKTAPAGSNSGTVRSTAAQTSLGPTCNQSRSQCSKFPKYPLPLPLPYSVLASASVHPSALPPPGHFTFTCLVTSILLHTVSIYRDSPAPLHHCSPSASHQTFTQKRQRHQPFVYLCRNPSAGLSGTARCVSSHPSRTSDKGSCLSALIPIVHRLSSRRVRVSEFSNQRI